MKIRPFSKRDTASFLILSSYQSRTPEHVLCCLQNIEALDVLEMNYMLSWHKLDENTDTTLISVY